ncbi:hypothetical protein Anas_13885 [Armadillidium nasatum]|uniref:Uncharacterized protein n=1 Tax=Armadillidium nasatum TaxID=96803 RepID=A0A5N5T4L2_9CRUS|nr:hypothetical protein Anas_13885 [Armadillidium nasatum]
MCCFNKFILFTTNVIIFVFGVAVIAISSVTISRASGYNELLREGTVALPIIILCFGIFITLFGFMGCLGALWQNKCMLYTYAIIVLSTLPWRNRSGHTFNRSSRNNERLSAGHT